MMNFPRKYFFRISHADRQNLKPENILPDDWNLRDIHSRHEHEDFYDTFEWEALDKGFVIVRKRNALFILDSKTGLTRASMMSTVRRSSFFPGDLPAGKVRELLVSCSDIRAFIKICSFNTDFRSSHLLDENGISTGILTTESFFLPGRNENEPVNHIITFQPFRDCGKAIEKLEKSFSSLGEQVEPIDFRALFLELMGSTGLNPGGYSSKLQMQLDPDASIYQSAREVLLFTLSVMRQNEPGIRKNIDSEFLHDYRVAVRRTRSILKQLKGVFEPRERGRYLDAFRDLGKLTGPLRDCDVYLLKKSQYISCLPPSLQHSLCNFFDEISSDRSKYQKKLSKYLVSEEYKSFLMEWERFISHPIPADQDKAPQASLSTITVALKSIKKAWKKVIRNGRQVGIETSDIDLHALRINCKKLRYLLEFFSSLFPYSVIHPVIGHLKVLQDNLGNFIDLTIQQRYLQTYLGSLSAGRKDLLRTAAIGGLMATLYQRQEKARGDFHSAFREFDNHETEQLFHHLLASID
ncbi:MAG: CHAD domain-containing protein [Chlorobiaceae bacterium]|nr:CHAD domain-containing protein [Chlorobiaceae bacterium]